MRQALKAPLKKSSIKTKAQFFLHVTLKALDSKSSPINTAYKE